MDQRIQNWKGYRSSLADAIFRRPKWQLRLFCLGLTAAIVFLQGIAGRTSLSAFYAIPISILAWFDGMASAVLLSVITVVAGLIVDFAALGPFSFSDAASGLTRTVFFGFLSLVLPRLHFLQTNLETLANERGRALAEEVAARQKLEHEMLEASESEQRGIGRDLHDGLSQHLAATALASYAHARSLSVEGHPQTEKARKIVDLIEQAIASARAISKGLHPIEMGGDGLMKALEEFVVTTSELFEVHCELDCPFPVIVDTPSAAAHLYRITQEAVSNAIRHGHATDIEVFLGETDTGLQLRVSDNGSGLPNDISSKKGLGLNIMATRAKFMGGNFSIGRNDTVGTKIICDIPEI
jgi:signal transduction histidine kinase